MGGRLLRTKTSPRLRVLALHGCLMKAIPAPVSTTAALLGLLKLSQFCPGACDRLTHGGPHRSLYTHITLLLLLLLTGFICLFALISPCSHFSYLDICSRSSPKPYMKIKIYIFYLACIASIWVVFFVCFLFFILCLYNLYVISSPEQVKKILFPSVCSSMINIVSVLLESSFSSQCNMYKHTEMCLLQ